jgi:hypothetical protein
MSVSEWLQLAGVVLAALICAAAVVYAAKVSRWKGHDVGTAGDAGLEVETIQTIRRAVQESAAIEFAKDIEDPLDNDLRPANPWGVNDEFRIPYATYQLLRAGFGFEPLAQRLMALDASYRRACEVITMLNGRRPANALAASLTNSRLSLA